MIFSKNIYKLASGNNASIFAKSENNYDFFAENVGVQKYHLTTSKHSRCLPEGKKLSYNHITKLTDDIVCVCFDGNISIAYENQI